MACVNKNFIEFHFHFQSINDRLSYISEDMTLTVSFHHIDCFIDFLSHSTREKEEAAHDIIYLCCGPRLSIKLYVT